MWGVIRILLNILYFLFKWVFCNFSLNYFLFFYLYFLRFIIIFWSKCWCFLKEVLLGRYCYYLAVLLVVLNKSNYCQISPIIATFLESVSLFFLSSGSFYFLGNNWTYLAIIGLILFSNFINGFSVVSIFFLSLFLRRFFFSSLRRNKKK